MRPDWPDDRGSVLILILGYAVILAALSAVLIDVSAVFLARRSLASAADGAAVAGAQALDESALYGTDMLDLVPLAQRDAEVAVESYVAQEMLAERFPGLVPLSVLSDGRSVDVTAQAVVRLPVLGVLAAGWADGVPLSVTATAQAPFSRP